MTTARLALSFWAVVEDCLVDFHEIDRPEAAKKVADLWRRLPAVEGDADESFSDIIYHTEPWQVACHLANSDLAMLEYQSEYRELMARNGLSPVTAPEEAVFRVHAAGIG